MEEKPASKPVESAPPASGKAWERPWSIAEMKEGSREWTLASDAGVSKVTDHIKIILFHIICTYTSFNYCTFLSYSLFSLSLSLPFSFFLSLSLSSDALFS